MSLGAPRRLSGAELPVLLREADVGVEGLWVLGSDLRALGPMIAIVGARRATPYGLQIAHDLGADLAARGICVVSGMARGIDAAAHEGALAGGGPTLAVLGSGVDMPFPTSNRGLYERILARGAVVSERPLGAKAFKKHFPERNRIIAGISLGTVLVQAAWPFSGALGTAKLCVDLNRTLFAVPGDLRSSLSTGPHAMIRNGAKLATGVGDILSELDGELAAPVDARALPDDLDPAERAVAEAARAGPAPVDVLAARAGLDVVAVQRALSMLEVRGICARAPGGAYRSVG